MLDALRGLPGVVDVHHLHLWHMQEQETAREAHIVQDGTTGDSLRQHVKDLLADRFHIRHSVVELVPRVAAGQGAPVIGQ